MPEEQNNSRVVRALDVFGNIFCLNVLYVIFSLPIITIGASTTALYGMAIRLVRKEEGPMVKGFIGLFKENFKRATLLWLMVLGVLVILFGEYLYVINFEGTMASFYIVVIVVELFVLALILPFLFPLVARYENTLINTIKNAALLSISNLGSWIKILLAWVAPIILSLSYPMLFFYTWYLWILIAFGVIAYGTSFTLRKVFNRITIVQEAAQAEEERKKAINKTKKLSDHLIKPEKKSSEEKE